MLDKLKKKIDNAFNAAAQSYDELRASVPDYLPVPATAVFIAELVWELAGKKRQKPQP